MKEGTLKRATFERRMPKVESEVVRLLEDTFVDVEGLEPTNNTAERALRPAVLWRKSSWGTHSPQGGLFVARMLTVVATLKQQRNVLEFLASSCEASLRAQTGPSLLPS